MGHYRLGIIPKSRKWTAVVAQVAGSVGEGATTATLDEDVQQIAASTLDAAQQGLEKAVNDAGLRHTFFLLTQVVLAAREKDWQERLGHHGIKLTEQSTTFDLICQVQHAVDAHLAGKRFSTDISEMAQRAAGESLAALAEPRTASLFGEGDGGLQATLRELSTKAGFARLGQKFFGRFLTRYLNFFLSRVTAGHAGSPRLQQIGDLTRFNDALALHCEQSALVVRTFCGDWYSKTQFQEGITSQNSARFMAVALAKLKAELAQQGAEA